ncbi:hypothetical protein BDW74DRAFT_179139 [Aspergillus multicolor]|uniref:uncharacterized protein n=1 Tax=Aspergillus multicolor TaxID=41759 RepID=UPI003CCDEA34
MSYFLPLLPFRCADERESDRDRVPDQDVSSNDVKSASNPTVEKHSFLSLSLVSLPQPNQALSDTICKEIYSQEAFGPLAVLLRGVMPIDAEDQGEEQDKEDDIGSENPYRSGMCLLDDSDIEDEKEEKGVDGDGQEKQSESNQDDESGKTSPLAQEHCPLQ